MPSLILLAVSTQDIPSQEKMQQGDPASMSKFSLELHPTATEIAERTQLNRHSWYTDDCTPIGTHAELNKAVEILHSKGPDHGLYLNMAKTRQLWLRQPVNQTTPLLHRFHSENLSHEGMDLLRAPIGSPHFMQTFLNSTSSRRR